MSTSVSDHQRGKGPGNSGKPPLISNNGSKGGDYEEVDSWRNQPQHHQQQGYGQASDPYMSSYYGSFQQQQQQQYQNQGQFGVNENGPAPWSTNGGEMGFLGGGGGGGGNYGPQQGMHDSQGGRYEGDGQMFTGGGGRGSGGFNNFGGGGGGGPGFGYGGYGNGDYSTWGGPQPRKHYDEYYGGSRDGMYDERGIKMMEHGMGGLNVRDGGSDKDLQEMMGGGGGSKKTTWATIASQPAKPEKSTKKKSGMLPPPIIPGTWEGKNGQVAKAPIAAPVQAPHPPPAWERPKMAPPQPGPPPQQHAPPSHSPPSGGGHHGGSRGGGGGYQQPPMSSYRPPHQQHGPPPHHQYNQSHSYSHSQHSHAHAHAPPPPPPSKKAPSSNSDSDTPAAPPVAPEKLNKHEYNPTTFDLSADGARFFVIKSYSEDDIHRSIKYEIWCSTEHGNRRLDQAWKEREDQGPIFLFFSVNGSGHFCGMAQMISHVDYNSSSSVWSQDKWKGKFKVKWVYVKDVPNAQLRNIRLENNENKPVTNSRDTQEVPYEKGKQVLKIIHTYPHTTSIFDDFNHYEKRQEEEDQRRTVPAPPSHNMHDRNEQGGGGSGRGRGGYQGGNHYGAMAMADSGHGGGHMSGRGRDRDFGGNRGGPDNQRDFRDHGDRMDRNNDRMDHRGGGGGMDRGPPDHYNGRGGGDGNHRDFYARDRPDREYPRGGGGGMRGGGRGGHHPMRN